MMSVISSLLSHPNRSGKWQARGNRRRVRFEDSWMEEFEQPWWDDEDEDDEIELVLDLN